jgi:hypothetical protein
MTPVSVGSMTSVGEVKDAPNYDACDNIKTSSEPDTAGCPQKGDSHREKENRCYDDEKDVYERTSRNINEPLQSFR